MGEIFSVKTKTRIRVKNPKTASIGTGVRIGKDSEDIINDILEDNKIIYTRDNKDRLYITAPNIQGSDIYNSIDFI